MKFVSAAALMAPCLFVVATPVFAQDAAPPQDASQVADVVVTARKRSENVQDVPATIQAVGSEQLNNAGVSTFRDLARVAPGLNIANAPSPNQFAVTIRGVGSKPGNPSFDSSVSLFLDGVYTPRAREFSSSLFDMNGLEVIRGTQAALLGKNTSLGAVNLITRKPGEEYGANLIASHEFELGSDRFEAGVNLPLADTFKVRLAALSEELNGPMRDRISGYDGESSTTTAGRITAVWTPTDTVDITGMYQGYKRTATGGNAEFISITAAATNLAAAAGYPGVVEGNRDYQTALYSPALGGTNRGETTADRGALTINWKLGDHTLTAQTGYTQSESVGSGNTSYMPGNYGSQQTDDDSRQWTQEIRLVSPTGGRLDYILGALYLKGSYDNVTTQSAFYPAVSGQETTFFYQDSSAVSAFGQANYVLMPGLRATAGLRYTREKKDVDLERRILIPGVYSVVVMPPYAPFSLSRTEESVDGSIGLSYKLSPHALIYASWGQGTKAGGFAQAASILPNSEYEAEVAQTLEAGVKLQSSDRRVTFNAAAFHTVVDDFQLVTFNGVNFNVGNTDLESNGVEWQAFWAAADGLSFYWNNTYAKAEDTRVGGDIAFAPRWQGVVGGSYEHAVFGGLTAGVDMDVTYRSDQTSQEKGVAVPSLGESTQLNASLSVSSPTQGWDLRLIGKNLTDEYALGFVFPGPLLPAGNVVGIPTNPRTVSLQLSFKY